MIRVALLAAVAALSVAASAQGQPRQERGSAAAARSAFCRGLDQTTAGLLQGDSAFAARDPRETLLRLNTKRRSTLPGFDTLYIDTASSDFLTANFYGIYGNSRENALQIMGELADAIVACYPGATKSGPQDREASFIRIGVATGGGRPSYNLTASFTFGGTPTFGAPVSMSVSVWRPGRFAESQRGSEERNRRYTGVGCPVGDDLCVTRRAIAR